MPGRTIPIHVLGALLLSGCAEGPESTVEPATHNVVVISVDSLRADHMGVYGYTRPTTPFLDTFARDSVVFDAAYAPSSFTLQSVAAVLTGRLPTSGGSIGLLEAQPAENAETLGRLFRAGGVKTGFVTNQPLLRPRGFTRGFNDIQISPDDSVWPAAEVADRGLRFIDDYAPERFFLFAHFLDPHTPYAPPPETAARFGVASAEVALETLVAEIDSGKPVAADDARIAELTALYDAEIAAVDAAIASFMHGLEQRGLAENTIVIVTGSQGEELLEHGYLGHAWTVHGEVLAVPLIVHAPGLLAPRRIAASVSTVDLYPSLLAWFGFDAGDWQPDGTSFIRRSDTGWTARPAQTAQIAELVIRERCIVRTVIADGWKYVAETLPCPVAERGTIQSAYLDRVRAHASGESEVPPLWGEVAAEALFDLAADPGETENLAASEPERLAFLRAVLDDYRRYCELNALKATEAVAPEVTDPAAAERLRALGYL